MGYSLSTGNIRFASSTWYTILSSWHKSLRNIDMGDHLNLKGSWAHLVLRFRTFEFTFPFPLVFILHCLITCREQLCLLNRPRTLTEEVILIRRITTSARIEIPILKRAWYRCIVLGTAVVVKFLYSRHCSLDSSCFLHIYLFLVVGNNDSHLVWSGHTRFWKWGQKLT
jgi:hypothetical protein